MPRKKQDPTVTAKKRRHRLTLAERKKIIVKSVAGSSIGRVAQDLNISPEAVSQVLKTAGGLIKPENEGESQSLKKKGDLSVVEKAILIWYKQQCSLGKLISTQKFRNKAMEFYHKINNNELFKASNSWVESFKKRHQITNLSIDSNDPDKTAKIFSKKMKRLLLNENIDPDVLFNVDEVLLSWRTFPCNLVQKPDTGFDRISIITCCNASGTVKIPLVIVGREKFEAEEDSDYYYNYQPEGLVDEEIFKNWYMKIFKKFCSGEKKKCYLILDNAPPHFASVLDDDKESCEIRRLGLEMNPLVQPINKIANKLKIAYRAKLMNQFKIGLKVNVEIFLKNWKLPDACRLLTSSWEQMQGQQIEEAWGTNYDIPLDLKIPREFIIKVRKMPGLSWCSILKIREWFAQDQGHAWKVLSDDEIIEKAKQTSAEESRERLNKNNNNSNCSMAESSIKIKEEVLELVDDSNMMTYPEERQNLDCMENVPSKSDALRALNTIQKWIQSKTDGDQRHCYLFDQMRKIVEDGS